jgi:hypothetical protein
MFIVEIRVKCTLGGGGRSYLDAAKQYYGNQTDKPNLNAAKLRDLFLFYVW